MISDKLQRLTRQLRGPTPLTGIDPAAGNRSLPLTHGKLLLEVTDPDPIDPVKYAKVGFEAYCSHIQIRNVKVRQLSWETIAPSYAPEF